MTAFGGGVTGGAGRPVVGVHASCVILGEAGILIRGPSASGKSTLARRVVSAGRTAGHFSRWVADDRVLVEAVGSRLVARPIPALAGLAEHRGLGIGRVAFEPACRLGLVVDLEAGARLPEPADQIAWIEGVGLPGLRVDLAGALDAVWSFRGYGDTRVTET